MSILLFVLWIYILCVDPGWGKASHSILLCSAVCAFLCRQALQLVLSGVYPFPGSREAAPTIPSLFTLLFSSIYSALQLCGAGRTKQLFHYEGNSGVNTQSSTLCCHAAVRDSPSHHDECLALLARLSLLPYSPVSFRVLWQTVSQGTITEFT